MQAARETGALKEAKDKLEKQVEELTWRLQLEKRLRVIVYVVKSYLYGKAIPKHLKKKKLIYHFKRNTNPRLLDASATLP